MPRRIFPAGGALRRFFDEDLPRAELVKETLAEALAATRAHPTEALKPILADALSDLATSLERDRTAAIALARAEGDRVRDHVYEPLRALREVLEELVD